MRSLAGGRTVYDASGLGADVLGGTAREICTLAALSRWETWPVPPPVVLAAAEVGAPAEGLDAAVARSVVGTRWLLLVAGAEPASVPAGLDLEAAHPADHPAFPTLLAASRSLDANAARNEAVLARLALDRIRADRAALQEDLRFALGVAAQLEADLEEMRAENTHLVDIERRYERTRNSLSFQIGHAQVLAVKRPGKDTALLIPRVVRALRRGNPPVPPPVDRAPPLEHLAATRPAVLELLERAEPAVRATERSFLGAGLPKLEDGYAALVGSRALAVSMGRCPVHPVTPSSWPIVFSHRPPSFVLIEAGLAERHGPWGQLGDRAYPETELRLHRLLSACERHSVPVVLWDAGDDPAPALLELAPRVALSLSVDEQGLEHLARAGASPDRLGLEPLGVAFGGFGPQSPDDRIAFIGDFDRRLPPAERAARAALWAEAGPSLVVYDDHRGEMGRRSAPAELSDRVVGRLAAGALAPHRLLVFGALGRFRRADRRALDHLAAGASVVLTHRGGLGALESLFPDVGRLDAPAGPIRPTVRRALAARHRFGARLGDIARRLGRSAARFDLPPAVLVADPKSASEQDRLLDFISRQSERPRAVLLPEETERPSVEQLGLFRCERVQVLPPHAVVVPWRPGDDDEHQVLDAVLATVQS